MEWRSKASAIYPWFILFVNTLSLMGVYAAYDSAGALAIWLERDVDITPTKLGLLYSAYSGPIVIFALFCGQLIDTIGTTLLIILFQIMICVGGALFARAYTFPNLEAAFITMMVSRVFVGTGGEGLAIACRKLLFLWFDEKNQSLAISFIMTIPYLGTQFAFICLPLIAKNHSGSLGFWVIFLACVASAGCSLVYIVLSHFFPAKRAKDVVPKKKGNLIVLYIVAIRKFPWRFWALLVSDMLIQGAIWPFVAFSPDFFYRHYGFSEEVSGIFATILAGGAIPLGFFVGFLGRKIPGSIIGMNSCFLQVICFLQLGWLTQIYPIYSVIGLAFLLGSMGATIYAPVSRMIHYNELGMALGLLKSAESFSWLVTPPIYGYIYEMSGDYAYSCTFFAIMGCVAFPLQLLLFITRKGMKPHNLDEITVEEPKQFIPSENDSLTKDQDYSKV